MTRKIPGSILRVVSVDEITIEALDGQTTILSNPERENTVVSSDFKKLGLDQLSLPTGSTSIDVYEMIANGNFAQVYETFKVRKEKIIMPQSQVIAFCDKYPDLISQAWGVLFLINEDFVVIVSKLCNGQNFRLYKFDDPVVWSGTAHLKVVVPKR